VLAPHRHDSCQTSLRLPPRSRSSRREETWVSTSPRASLWYRPPAPCRSPPAPAPLTGRDASGRRRAVDAIEPTRPSVSSPTKVYWLAQFWTDAELKRYETSAMCNSRAVLHSPAGLCRSIEKTPLIGIVQIIHRPSDGPSRRGGRGRCTGAFVFTRRSTASVAGSSCWRRCCSRSTMRARTTRCPTAMSGRRGRR
jgi:hypothetical protein